MIFAKPWCQTNYQNPKQQPWKIKLSSILHCLASKAPPLIQLPSKLYNAYHPNTMQHTINIKNKDTLITAKNNQSQRSSQSKPKVTITLPSPITCKKTKPQNVKLIVHMTSPSITINCQKFCCLLLWVVDIIQFGFHHCNYVSH